MSEFDEAIATTRQGSNAVGRLDDGWTIVGGSVNGGLLMALGLQALRAPVLEAGGGPDPIVWSAHFLSASQPGPLTARTDVLRVGRSVGSGQVSLYQGEAERLRILASFADLGEEAPIVYRAEPRPDLPPPEQCIRATRQVSDLTAEIAILDRFELRLDPACAGFGVGRPSGRGELRGWLRLADGREPDVLALAAFLDAFPPAVFDLGASGWAPTLELTGHIRRRPAPGWVAARITTTNVIGDYFEEDCSLWDSSGALVAQARQLAGVRMPAQQ